ncbi:GGDEF domain-containing response regulator [Sulfurospirillum barnesii]|uniref:diguanylate cyclase n=1 Tax=Sulfurospirillum barnesii (strain ATCC 700032 / DSM 10660 / SES-3) TaxID=760154 RepID=I3XVP4_SULBS|nr:diguanylate cyclase [Sulfurospirillum barnesii]AFL68018.1 diguanylate cyclase (GGDEF) domain-containing protein [Sulfurospirillum barnesii SES-3]
MAKEKILIVEDNKALSKLIVKKMESSLAFDVDAAYTYAEAEALIEKSNDYFLALLDLNLPDAPNGEVVDMVLSHKIPSIVLTGSIDKEVREAILKKEVIDYVYKGNIDDVNYIFTLIERLHKNRDIKVMVVDDSMATRSQIKSLLHHQMFKVIVAAHGEEALVFLEDNPDIKLILTDFQMPVINGVELTKEVRKKYSKNEISIIAMTGTNTELISAKFLKIGANDFINKPFTREEIACRINNSLDSLEYIAKIQDMAQNDFLSGLANRRYFFDAMHEYFNEAKKRNEPFALGLIDVDNFKHINDTLGHRVGDTVIVELAKKFKEYLVHDHFLARIGGDEFCLVLKNMEQKKALEFFLKLKSVISTIQIKTKEGDTLGVSVSIGVTFGDLESVEEMINQADRGLYLAKKNGKNRIEVA